MNESQEYLDQTLFFQILIARLGEKGRQAWWETTDATDIRGGGSFFQRFLPDAEVSFIELSAVEAAIMAARAAEKARMREFDTALNIQSIFSGSPEWDAQIRTRWAHWKRHPHDMPEKARTILSSAIKSDDLIDELNKIRKNKRKLKTEKTQLGTKLSTAKSSQADIADLVAAIDLDTSEWSLPFYDRNS